VRDGRRARGWQAPGEAELEGRRLVGEWAPRCEDDLGYAWQKELWREGGKTRCACRRPAARPPCAGAPGDSPRPGGSAEVLLGASR